MESLFKIAKPQTRRQEAGYTLLMVVFMVATILIFSAAAVPSVLTQGRRERETETIWRGEQYERAIGLYFQKFGRYPTKIDDLTKQTNGVRFLRQAYPDPMNKEDGTWRFIYVGPNGQLIGSLKSTSLLQSVLGTATEPASPFGASATAPGATTPGAGQAGQQNQQQGQQTNSALAPNPLAAQPQSLSGAVIGGNIIGVGSKVKQASIRVYQQGDTYEKWEFIWNPQQQVAIPGQGAAGPAAPAAPGQQPTDTTLPPGATPPSGANPPAPTIPPTTPQ